MKLILQPAEGEVLKLGPPAAGEVVIKVDPQQAGTGFAAGTETLLPGSEIPSHRHLDRSEVLFVHKGQGRVILDGQSVTVLPGTSVFIPKQSWWSLRNTGTGLLQWGWVSEPGGIEQFFRELSQAGASVDAGAFQQIAQRHGIELGATPVSAASQVPGRRHRRRRGGGRSGSSGPSVARAGAGGQPALQAPGAPHADVPSGPEVQHAADQPALNPPAPGGQRQPGAGQEGRGRRRRRRGRGGGAGRPAIPQGSAGTGPAAAPAVPGPRPSGSPAGQKPPARRAERKGGRPRRFGRVKEVYMGGKWVRVVGEGPVISGDAASENKEELDD